MGMIIEQRSPIKRYFLRTVITPNGKGIIQADSFSGLFSSLSNITLGYNAEVLIEVLNERTYYLRIEEDIPF